MVVIPAIDVQAGRCVRLRRGDHASATVYGDEPDVVARNFIAAGATRLHVVDLDAARGVPLGASAEAVARVVAVCVDQRCDVEVGGGVRDIAAAMHWIERGAAFVILGSIAAQEPEIAVAICEATAGRVLLGLDVRAGVARVQGWTEDGMAPTSLLRRWRTWIAAGVVYGDTTRDGVLAGPNLEGLRQCIELYGGPVILSGGISTVEDIAACASAGAAGVIVGKALYDGHVDLPAALRVAASAAR